MFPAALSTCCVSGLEEQFGLHAFCQVPLGHGRSANLPSSQLSTLQSRNTVMTITTFSPGCSASFNSEAVAECNEFGSISGRSKREVTHNRSAFLSGREHAIRQVVCGLLALLHPGPKWNLQFLTSASHPVRAELLPNFSLHAGLKIRPNQRFCSVIRDVVCPTGQGHGSVQVGASRSASKGAESAARTQRVVRRRSPGGAGAKRRSGTSCFEASGQACGAGRRTTDRLG